MAPESAHTQWGGPAQPSTAEDCLQNILDKIFQKKDAKIFGSSEIVAIFAIPFGKQANT